MSHDANPTIRDVVDAGVERAARDERIHPGFGFAAIKPSPLAQARDVDREIDVDAAAGGGDSDRSRSGSFMISRPRDLTPAFPDDARGASSRSPHGTDDRGAGEITVDDFFADVAARIKAAEIRLKQASEPQS